MKKLSIIAALIISLTFSSCNRNSKSDSPKDTIQCKTLFSVLMDDSLLYHGSNSDACILDYETMETSELCNILNCSHTTSECLVKTLKATSQLPMIYNNCAYYFVNSSSAVQIDGKRKLELKTTIMEYDFKSIETKKLVEISGANADISGGGYLLGNEYYFITNYGNPKYDEEGNLFSTSTGGGGNLMSINLDNEIVTDYGEIFDYEALKKEYAGSSSSTSIQLIGKIDSKLYIGISCIKDEITLEMLESGLLPNWSGFTYTFDLKTHEYNMINEEFSTCAMNGYNSYLIPQNDEYILMLENIENGLVTEGPMIQSFQYINIIDDKVWYDSKCYDINTGIEKRITNLNTGTAVSVYDGYYIIQGENNIGHVEFEKIPCEEIDKLFE